MSLRQFFFNQPTYSDYASAIKHYRRAIRQGDTKRAHTWLAVAERCLRLQGLHDALILNDDTRVRLQEEQPHRMKWLVHRGNFGR